MPIPYTTVEAYPDDSVPHWRPFDAAGHDKLPVWYHTPDKSPVPFG